jgi:hypothetical protein
MWRTTSSPIPHSGTGYTDAGKGLENPRHELRYRKEALLVIIALLVSTFAIAWTNADIKTSSLFFIDSRWPIGEQFPWKLLYRIDRFPAITMAAFGLVMFALSMYRPNKSAWQKPGLFLLLLLVIGPGLIVNATFKTTGADKTKRNHPV